MTEANAKEAKTNSKSYLPMVTATATVEYRSQYYSEPHLPIELNLQLMYLQHFPFVYSN